mmetsp:Transcript_30437/g.79767  ORF Transcript_30437/g.79767 Transcript_30437/m.79767 type:complete len:239 (-) Transcript_30437:107-823(-)
MAVQRRYRTRRALHAETIVVHGEGDLMLQRRLLASIKCGVLVRLVHSHLIELGWCGDRQFQLVPRKHANVLGRAWHVLEVRHVQVNVLVVEHIHNGLVHRLLEVHQVEDHSGNGVKGTADGYGDLVVVPVPVRVVALAVECPVIFVRQPNGVQAVGRRELRRPRDIHDRGALFVFLGGRSSCRIHHLLTQSLGRHPVHRHFVRFTQAEVAMGKMEAVARAAPPAAQMTRGRTARRGKR